MLTFWEHLSHATACEVRGSVGGTLLGSPGENAAKLGTILPFSYQSLCMYLSWLLIKIIFISSNYINSSIQTLLSSGSLRPAKNWIALQFLSCNYFKTAQSLVDGGGLQTNLHHPAYKSMSFGRCAHPCKNKVVLDYHLIMSKGKIDTCGLASGR